ncbi:sodium-translocating pyrophosphatase [Petrotoga sp. 9PWA.NaAc.5.4]|uniref:sodium-translocating pyrophosphatase n=1 Tax=Petrotoga sp. 9PWA.NaAc.5.4 TaxID=1434328 RepID=UPI000CB16C42|nr:sodium-translocating pyrophosphatase [Petrotoga sp. 9PWA.NaAc.5.4]PNR95933.1 potassium transporter [Petrotoga sp. 9PWA.NaAc.5.4]
MGAIFQLIAVISGGIGLIFTVFLVFNILEKPAGNEKMQKLSKAIQVGAKSFLFSEYKILFLVIILSAILLWQISSFEMSLSFGLGAMFSILSGFFGMSIATRANTRTTQAAINSLKGALTIAFNAGAVMGITVTSLGLIGLGMIFYFGGGNTEMMGGYAMGASFVALFARVGGGIFTKAADVGADLVGKLEANIPEDDPRNPAVIADNVGDNVGDVAGMGADLYESYIGSIYSASVLGGLAYSLKGAIFPFFVASSGLILSIIGIVSVNYFIKKAKNINPQKALNFGTYLTSFLQAIIVLFLSKIILNTFQAGLIVISGMIVGILIGAITEHYTSKKPVFKLAQNAPSGSAPLIINGLALGMESTLFPIIFIGASIVISFTFYGLFGIAIASVGMLSTLGMTLSIDAYGPIADNAGGIAEMAGLESSVRQRTDKLDSVGNTTAAIGKGFAIGSAALTALALFASYIQVANVSLIDLNNANVFTALLIGAMLPFLFSALVMKAVGNAATLMVQEVRRQFNEIVGLMEGKAEPDYGRCVKIATNGALKHMILPALIAVISPMIVYFLLGKEAVAGMLAGTTVSGVMLAIFMANSGGAWDNAKKYIEEGNLGGKGSMAHKAAVVGDTVGDPLKDTAGPSINILIKLMSIVSIVVIPLLIRIFE